MPVEYQWTTYGLLVSILQIENDDPCVRFLKVSVFQDNPREAFLGRKQRKIQKQGSRPAPRATPSDHGRSAV